jgi:AraC-like DNA-binding protein
MGVDVYMHHIPTKDFSELQTQLAELVNENTSSNGATQCAIEGVTLYRFTDDSLITHELWSPGLCLIASGRKRIFLGDKILEHDASEYLLLSVDLPLTTFPINASTRHPYLALRIDLDPSEIANLAIESQINLGNSGKVPEAFSIVTLRARLLDAVVRLLTLLNRPNEIKILKPMILREISFLLLSDPLGEQLRAIALKESQSQRIYRVINKIKSDYRNKLRIRDLAEIANMSESSLHHYFKSMTSMSPLQYQKQIRLQEARNLLLKNNYDAASAAFEVGYDSPAQFSREYKRLFGSSPIRDTKYLKNI